MWEVRQGYRIEAISNHMPCYRASLRSSSASCCLLATMRHPSSSSIWS
jgi:hypothetical protein